jgi:Lipid membrane protein of large eukaryotic DNA viruses
MGASVSTNVNKLATDALTKVASEIVQDSRIHNSSSQIVSVTNVDGDVVINGNTVTQRVNVNMSALFDAMASDEAQEKLATNVSQQAKALISGINLAQFSAATNIMKTFINAVIEISNDIRQHCLAANNQQQSIIVKNVHGSTAIHNNVLDQVTDIVENCISHSVNQNEALQSIATRLQQAASSSSVGISEWALFAFVGLLIGAPIVGGTYVLKYTFPLMIIVGLCMIGWYLMTTKADMTLTSFSDFINNSDSCKPLTSSTPVDDIATAEDAGTQCMSDGTCKAFDFKTNKETTVKTTTFYTDISTGCSIGSNNKNLLSNIQLSDGAGLPTSKIPSSNLQDMVPYDLYVDTTTTKWYQMNDNRIWEENPKLIDEKEPDAVVKVSGAANINRITIPDGDNAYLIYLNPTDLSFWQIYKKTLNKWEAQPRFKKEGPKNRKVARIPSVFNVSGIKTVYRKQWLLYLGISLTLVGVVGTVYNNTSKTRSQNKTT